MDQPESFDVTEYGDDESGYDKVAALKQIVTDMVRENPAIAVTCRIEGDKFVLQYHCSESHLYLPARMRMVQEQEEAVFKEAVKEIKKKFKVLTKKALGLKELKDKAGSNVQKTSLNERYYYLAWRVYELG